MLPKTLHFNLLKLLHSQLPLAMVAKVPDVAVADTESVGVKPAERQSPFRGNAALQQRLPGL